MEDGDLSQDFCEVDLRNRGVNSAYDVEIDGVVLQPSPSDAEIFVEILHRDREIKNKATNSSRTLLLAASGLTQRVAVFCNIQNPDRKSDETLLDVTLGDCYKLPVVLWAVLVVAISRLSPPTQPLLLGHIGP